MHKSLMIRLLVTGLAIGCAVYGTVYSLHPYGEFPFKTHSGGGFSRIIAPRQGVALPPGLQAGDRFDYREQNLATRAAFHVNVRPGETYTLQLRRQGRFVTVPVTTISPLASEAGVPIQVYFFVALLLVLGLVTLWWGHDWAAWGLSLFAIAFIVNTVLFLPLPSVAAFAAWLFSWSIAGPLTSVGLYLAAWSLAGGGIRARTRQVYHSVFALVLLIVFGALLAGFISTVMGWPFNLQGNWRRAWIALYPITLFIPVAVLAAGYRLANAEKRARLRWAIWSFTLFLGAIAWHNINLNIHVAGTIAGVAREVASILGLAGLLYGVLLKRVVPLSFVINRGLVYGLTAAVVVGIFALVETIVELTTLGGSAGLALNIFVSLAVGLGLDQIHKRVDDLIERTLFRRKHEAEKALERFAAHCPFIEHRERLLDEAVRVVYKHVQANGVALYERTEKAYACVARQGDEAFPERVETDDRAFVTLRAELRAADLHEAGSALGATGFAFPMALRGVLLGALVCGGRAERYAPDERALLARLAREVGVALHALRARENETLVEAIANGSLEPRIARARAQALSST